MPPPQTDRQTRSRLLLPGSAHTLSAGVSVKRQASVLRDLKESRVAYFSEAQGVSDGPSYRVQGPHPRPSCQTHQRRGATQRALPQAPRGTGSGRRPVGLWRGLARRAGRASFRASAAAPRPRSRRACAGAAAGAGSQLSRPRSLSPAALRALPAPQAWAGAGGRSPATASRGPALRRRPASSRGSAPGRRRAVRAAGACRRRGAGASRAGGGAAAGTPRAQKPADRYPALRGGRGAALARRSRSCVPARLPREGLGDRPSLPGRLRRARGAPRVSGRT